MTLQPDHPDFTASVTGEALPEDLAAFQEAVTMDPRILAESLALRRTADRLRAALAQDPALKGQLTASQRAAVLASAPDVPREKSPATSAPLPAARVIIPFPGMNSGTTAPLSAGQRTASGGDRPQPRRAPGAGKRLLSGPAAATAGIAAAVAVGIFFLAGSSPDSAPAAPGQSAKLQPQGIPVIALDPATAAGTASKAGLPAPGIPAISKKDPVILPGSPLESPAAPGSRSPAIATTPPDIRLSVPQAAPAAGNPPSGPLTETVPAPGAPPRRGAIPGPLASPGNR